MVWHPSYAGIRGSGGGAPRTGPHRFHQRGARRVAGGGRRSGPRPNGICNRHARSAGSLSRLFRLSNRRPAVFKSRSSPYCDPEPPPSARERTPMATDPYAACPCGSGKKFKWCCQDIHAESDKGCRLHEEGQHEAALRAMAEVVGLRPGNPEAWGRQAQLLSLNDKLDEAEQALEKAFAINPNYPFGHLLRGMFRQQEGEQIGALMLFRKASELYSPEAREPLA